MPNSNLEHFFFSLLVSLTAMIFVLIFKSSIANVIHIVIQGEVEIQGSFDEVSRTPLFAELLQDEEEEEAAGEHVKMQRSISVRVSAKLSRGTPE